MGFLSIISTVASIAAKVLPALLGIGKKEPDGAARFPVSGLPDGSYMVGSTVWYPSSGRVFTKNIGEHEATLFFERSTSDFAEPAITSLMTLPASGVGSVDVTDELQDYEHGNLTFGNTVPINPALLPSPDGGGPTRAISVAVKYLSVGAVVLGSGGVAFSIGRKGPNPEDNVEYYLRADFPKVIDIKAIWLRASARSQDGTTSTIDTGVSTHQFDEEEGNSITVDFPPGIKLGPVVRELSVYMELPNDAYMQITQESRRLIRTE